MLECVQIPSLLELENRFPSEGSPRDKMLFLLRYAILAPSTKNTQPWKFALTGTTVYLFGDRTKWQPVADPDGRELNLSLGCALENLLLAAERFGFDHRVEVLPETPSGCAVAIHPDEVASVLLCPGNGAASPERLELFHAIPHRQTHHGPYEDRPIPEAAMRRLREACGADGITLRSTADPGLIGEVEELNTRADIRLFSNADYRKELGEWVGRGAFGTPWLIAQLGHFATTLLNTGGRVARRDAAALRSAPLIGLICSGEDGRPSQVRAGQALERLWLTATALGIALQPMSSVLEVPDLKPELPRLLGASGSCPQQLVRIGYAEPESHRTPRLPLDEVVFS